MCSGYCDDTAEIALKRLDDCFSFDRNRPGFVRRRGSSRLSKSMSEVKCVYEAVSASLQSALATDDVLLAREGVSIWGILAPRIPDSFSSAGFRV